MDHTMILRPKHKAGPFVIAVGINSSKGHPEHNRSEAFLHGSWSRLWAASDWHVNTAPWGMEKLLTEKEQESG